MNELSNHDEAVELLQELGLKEYEARSFVALSRLPQGTAKEISEISEVPRTRVYDAIRVLESKGLVETQHSNPQQFRAVAVDRAVEMLRSEYEDRADSLRKTLEGLEPAENDVETEVTHEVWSMTGNAAISTRTQHLVDDATREVVLVVGAEGVFTEDLVERLQSAQDRGVRVIVGTLDEDLAASVEDRLPRARVFVSGLDWLRHAPTQQDDTEISRLLLVDRESILVSTFTERDVGDGERAHEHAVFGRGFDNGIVAVARRLMATGLPEMG
jgi:sugar-specific transcriptional regulator TrmB